MSKIHSKFNNYILKFNKKNKLELCISYVKVLIGSNTILSVSIV